ncbi:MAG: repeat:Tetratricopeptide 3:Tetratricopeptide 4 [Proteobacteria bacterium]|nr:repeat:Tetratricopeptide 3:Tetratricopeptide 4 [Pseudomonadota bacterium]
MASRFSRKISVPFLLASLLLTACPGGSPESMLSSAKDYLAKGDNKAAVIQLKNTLQSAPDNAEARFLLGKALLDSGNSMAAEIELRKAAALKFPPEQVVPQLAKAMLGLGQFKKLLEEQGETVLATGKERSDLLTSLAIANAALGKSDEAKQMLEQALQATPDYAPALLTQSRMKASARDADGALKITESVVAKDPKNAEALTLQADIVRNLGQMDNAMAIYRQALVVKPDFVPAHNALINAFLQNGKNDEAAKQLESLKSVAPNNPTTIFLETQLAYQKKDFKKAHELSLDLLKVASNNPYVLQLAGAIEFQLNSLTQAENYLGKAVQSAPHLSMARRLLIATYLRSGQPAKAMSALRPVLDVIDKDPIMLGVAGQVYLQNGDLTKAESYFAKASKLDPKDAKKRTYLAVTHLLGGNVDAGMSELGEIASSDTGITADLALISSQLRRKELDKALKSIAALEKKQPDNPLAKDLRGRTLLAKKDIPGARASFESALKLNPVYMPSVTNLARLDIADKKPDEARKRFEAVLVSDPKNLQALVALAELKQKNNGTPEEVASFLNKAISGNPLAPAPRILLVELYLNNKDPKKAVSAAQDAVSAIPDVPDLFDVLGRAQQAAGDLNQAITTYYKLAAAKPDLPLPHMRLAGIHLANKNKAAAAQALRKALEIKPDLVDAQRGLIALEMEAGNTAGALAIAKAVQKQRPKEAVGFLLEGDIGASKKSWDDAANAYRAGLKQAQTTDLAIKLHGVLVAAKKDVEAEKLSAEWLKGHPKDVVFRLYLGDLASAQKHYDVASKYYGSVLELQPNNALVLNNLAWVWGHHNVARGIEFAEKANKIAPNQAPFMDTLAMLLLEKGDTGKAQAILKKAVELQPQMPSIRLNYAKVLIKAGDKQGAKRELETLAKLGNKFGGQSEVTDLMKRL